MILECIETVHEGGGLVLEAGHVVLETLDLLQDGSKDHIGGTRLLLFSRRCVVLRWSVDVLRWWHVDCG